MCVCVCSSTGVFTRPECIRCKLDSELPRPRAGRGPYLYSSCQLYVAYIPSYRACFFFTYSSLGLLRPWACSGLPAYHGTVLPWLSLNPCTESWGLCCRLPSYRLTVLLRLFCTKYLAPALSPPNITVQSWLSLFERTGPLPVSACASAEPRRSIAGQPRYCRPVGGLRPPTTP